jgi:hypothetical protein
MLPHHSNLQTMSIATFPDENAHFGAGASACIQPSAPPALAAADGHRPQMMMSGEIMSAGPGAISELAAGLQNELEGLQAGIHQVEFFAYFSLLYVWSLKMGNFRTCVMCHVGTISRGYYHNIRRFSPIFRKNIDFFLKTNDIAIFMAVQFLWLYF